MIKPLHSLQTNYTMISTKDLRIGNKVSLRNVFICDVATIFKYCVSLNFNGNEGRFQSEEDEDLYPIDITDEIISTWWSNRKDRKTDDLIFSVDITTSKKHIVLNGNYYIKCDYLHQLQNIYWILTGNELKYKK